jgi:protein-disulfide isomerase
MRPWFAALVLAAGSSLAACHGPAPSGDAAFGEKVRAYLLAHPEVLQEVGQKLEAKEAADDNAAHLRAEASLPAVRAALERDPRDFVANPAGVVTVTEFYDYRCPHCVNAAPRVLAMIHDDPKVRVVFKEMPIFGPLSEHAARDALAVKAAGGDYLGLYQAYMAARPLDDAMVDRLALAHGARPADLGPAGAARADAQIARNTALFEKLDLGGTPAFIVGNQIILGDDMPAVARAVSQAEASTRT